MASVSPAQLQYFQQHKDDNKQGELYATAICTLILAWSFVGLRFLARWRIQASYKADDWLVVAAAATFTSFPVGMLLLNSVGFGRHIIFVTNAREMVEMVILCEISYSITIPLVKLSILSLYNRIFPSTTLFRVSVGIAICTVIYSLALAIVCILQCIPLSTLWGGNNGDGWCMDTTAPYTATAIANVVTDIAVLCLPMPFLYRLNMPLARKLQIVFVFGLGGCVCVFGVVRSIEVGTASPVDQSWSTVDGTIWSALEPAVAIICACLPTLRGLVPSTRNSHTGYTDDYDGDGDGTYSRSRRISRFGWPSIARGRRSRTRRPFHGGSGGRLQHQHQQQRRRSLSSSIALARGTGSSCIPSSSSTKPQVWSTVTSGLKSSSDRSRADTDAEDHHHHCHHHHHYHPFAKLGGGDGARSHHGPPSSRADANLSLESDDGCGCTGGGHGIRLARLAPGSAGGGSSGGIVAEDGIPPGRAASSLRKISLSDIHVRTEMHQEVSLAGDKV